MWKKTGLFGLLIGLLLVFLLAYNNQQHNHQPANSAPAKLPSDDVITFVTLNSPNTYYVNNENAFAGLEYDLAKLFAKHLGPQTKIKFIVADSVENVMATLINKKADIAAADLSITEARKKLITFTQPYQTVQQEVIYNSDETSDPAKSLSALANEPIIVPAATSFVERLKQLQKKEPRLSWQERDGVQSERLIEELAYGDIKYTVADDHLVDLMQNYYPNLRVAFDLGEPEKIAWGFSKTADPTLLKEANAFFTKIEKDGTLRNLVDRYHGNNNRLNPIDVKAFLSNSRTLLPKYKRLFQQAQEITGLDWRLIAAVSYRESHWDTFNTSPTGVRGLMMLTEDTADRMGVTDRLDPKQSIPAGAKYINLLIDSIPERIPEPDRTYLALASYNIGQAHVEDARVLAQRLNLNPDRWVDVKRALLLLRDPKYYANAKYGYASGGAPVIFVETIRSYYTILSRYEPPYQPDNNDPYKIADNTPTLLAIGPL